MRHHKEEARPLSVSLIEKMLATHQAADASETDSLRRIRELCSTASAPFSRDHFVPGHLTASAIVVDPSRTQVVLILHAKLHMWLQPGGHFEPGENDPSVAAAREVLEETGLKTRWPGDAPLLLDVDVHTIPARKNDPQHNHFDLRMLLVAEGQPQAAEVVAARWVKPAEFGPMKLDRGLQRALAKITFQAGA
jgi:8-oxo-dGTP pyrophosphatase MutT (NUDIX family)